MKGKKQSELHGEIISSELVTASQKRDFWCIMHSSVYVSIMGSGQKHKIEGQKGPSRE